MVTTYQLSLVRSIGYSEGSDASPLQGRQLNGRVKRGAGSNGAKETVVSAIVSAAATTVSRSAPCSTSKSINASNHGCRLCPGVGFGVPESKSGLRQTHGNRTVPAGHDGPRGRRAALRRRLPPTPELIDRWDLRIFVSAAFEETVDRARIRDQALYGSTAEVERRCRNRYIPAQQRHFATARPIDHADIIMHNDEPSGQPGKSHHAD